MLAACGEGGDCLGHLERAAARGATGEGELWDGFVHLRGLGVDAQLSGHVDDLVVADGKRHLHVAGVRGQRRRLLEGACAVAAVAVVLDCVPVVDFQGELQLIIVLGLMPAWMAAARVIVLNDEPADLRSSAWLMCLSSLL